MLFLRRSLWAWFTAGDTGTHSPVCGGLCQTLTNACVFPGLAAGLEGEEVGLDNVPPLLQEIALRENCLLEAYWGVERGQGRRLGARLCAAPPWSPRQAPL